MRWKLAPGLMRRSLQLLTLDSPPSLLRKLYLLLIPPYLLCSEVLGRNISADYHTIELVQGTRVLLPADASLKADETVFQELQEVNRGQEEAISKIKQLVMGAKNTYRNQIRYMREEDLQRWRFGGSKTLDELLAVLMRASEAGCKLLPNTTQLIAVASYLLCEDRVFAQVRTGEGKTLITGMLAAGLRLKNDQLVDVVTSSGVLAERDAKKMKPFFEKLGLSCSYIDEVGPESYTKADIMYGTMSNIKGDILRGEFKHQKKSRGGREFGALIVDESDNALIDLFRSSTYLSFDMTEFDFLHPVMVMIWSQVSELYSSLQYKNGGWVVEMENGEVQIQGEPHRYIIDHATQVMGLLSMDHRIVFMSQRI